MNFKISFCFLLICGLGSFNLSAQSEADKQIDKIESEVTQLAHEWAAAWNGKIDPNKMMSLYHPDMKYFWRGTYPAGDYDGFKQFLSENLSQTANYQLTVSNMDITVIDENTAIAFFQFKDQNEDPFGSGAATLVMTKKNADWKVLYVHESSIQEE